MPGETGWVSINEFAALYENSAANFLKQHAPIHFIYWEFELQALWACSIHTQRAGYLVMNEEYISEMAKRYLNMIREEAESIGQQKLYSWMAQNPGQSPARSIQPVCHPSGLFSPGRFLLQLVRNGKVTLFPRKRQRSPGANSSTCSNSSKRRR